MLPVIVIKNTYLSSGTLPCAVVFRPESTVVSRKRGDADAPAGACRMLYTERAVPSCSKNVIGYIKSCKSDGSCACVAQHDCSLTVYFEAHPHPWLQAVPGSVFRHHAFCIYMVTCFTRMQRFCSIGWLERYTPRARHRVDAQRENRAPAPSLPVPAARHCFLSDASHVQKSS